MGGCSSKPQTAECREISLFQTALKTSDSSAHQTLESLFNQHGRDGEDLLEDAQTLHELLLHAVESKELPHCKNQSAGDTALTTENAENCAHTKQSSSMSNLLENIDQEKGAATLEDSLPGTNLAAVATDENCRKVEVTPLDSPGKVAENRIHEGRGVIPNGAEENQENAGMLKAFAPDLAEMKPHQAEECGLPKVAEENAIQLESGGLDLETKSDLQKISMSVLPGCAEHEMQDFNPGPKSEDCLKNLEPNVLESKPTNDLQKIEAPAQSIESKEADPQALNELSMKGAIKRNEMAMGTSNMPKPDETCEKNEKALHSVLEEQSGKALEDEKIENAVEDEKTEMQCVKEALAMYTDRHNGQKTELQNEKAMEAEPPKIQFEEGWELLDQGKKAMEENNLSEKAEEAMECEKEDMQDEKAEEASGKAGVHEEESMREDEKRGLQNEKSFDGEVEKLQRDEDEKAVHMKNLAGGQGEGKTGVQNEGNLDGEVEKSQRVEGEKAVHTEKLAVVQGEEFTVCEAEKLDDKKDAKATMPEESLAMTEEGDDKSASDPLGAKEEKKKLEPLEEHGMLEAGGDLSAPEKSCMECVESKPNQKKPTEEMMDDATHGSLKTM